MAIQSINREESISSSPQEGVVLVPDALKIIFSYLGRSLVSVARTCRQWRAVIYENPMLYKKYLFASYINSCQRIPTMIASPPFPGYLIDLDDRYYYVTYLNESVNKYLSKPLEDKNCAEYLTLLRDVYRGGTKYQMRQLLDLYHDSICEQLHILFDIRDYNESHKATKSNLTELFEYHMWVNSSCDDMRVFIDTPHQHIFLAACSALCTFSMQFSNFDEILQSCLAKVQELEIEDKAREKSYIAVGIEQHLLIALVNKNIKEAKLQKRVDSKIRKEKVDLALEFLKKIDPALSKSYFFREDLYSILKFFIEEGHIEVVRTFLAKTHLTVYRPVVLHRLYLDIRSKEKGLETSKNEIMALSFNLKCEILIRLLNDGIEMEVAEALLKEIASQKLKLYEKISIACWMKLVDKSFAERLAQDLIPIIVDPEEPEFQEKMLNIASRLFPHFPETAKAAYYLSIQFPKKESSYFKALLKTLIIMGQFEEAKKQLENYDFAEGDSIETSYLEVFGAYHKSLFPSS